MLNFLKKQEHACAYGNAGSYMQCLHHKIHLAWRQLADNCCWTLEDLTVINYLTVQPKYSSLLSKIKFQYR